ncbi:MAG: hypothetical protein AAF202_11790 [Pseudomonadota bacterium]
MSLLIPTPGLSATLEIHSIEPTELDRAFYLITEYDEVEVILDCASFIHNLEVQGGESPQVFYLSHDECVENYKYLLKLNEERRCLNYTSAYYFLDDCHGMN